MSGFDVGVGSGWAPEWEWCDCAPVVRATVSEEAVARASPVAQSCHATAFCSKILSEGASL